MKQTFLVTALCLSLLVTAQALASENLLQDPDFSNVGPTGDTWQVVANEGGKTDPAGAIAGQASSLHIKAATLTQQVTLPEGLFELTVEASGKGDLILGVEGDSDRMQTLGKIPGLYGYLFHVDAGAHAVTIHIPMEGTVTNAAIQPATEEQKTAWANEQKSMAQFGFVTVSAQRPSPTAVAPLQFTGNVKPLKAMTQFAVLDEPRMDLGSVEHIDRLVDWLGDNGFARLDAPKLSAWIVERIKQGNAYGSVVVLDRGYDPSGLLEGPVDDPQWLQYLHAGGRIVSDGGLPFTGYAQSPTVEPSDGLNPAQNINLIDLIYGWNSYGWNSPYWGKGHLQVAPTPMAKAWGLENADASNTGMPVEKASIPFHVFTVAATGRQGATDWFRNLNPDMPWSGLVKILQVFDGNNDAALRDVWRASHYVGETVSIPSLPPPPLAPAPPKLAFHANAGGMRDRHEFVRGEKVDIEVTANASLSASEVRLELTDTSPGGTPLYRREKPLVQGKGAFTLDTAPYHDGEYNLTVTVLVDGKAVETAPGKIGIRYLQPEGFNFEVWEAAGRNPLRTDLEFADIHQAGLELYLADVNLAGVDAAVRNHMGFSLRSTVNFFMDQPKPTFEKNPEYFRLDNNGKPIPSVYDGGRPALGLNHPEILSSVRLSVEKDVKAVAGLPSFRPYVLCNDDFSAVYYGWDYTPRVVDAFKADTGLDAPHQMERPAKVGPVAGDNPWVSWFRWTLIHVDGGFFKAETEGAVAGRPDVVIGPIPGGAQIPLVLLLGGPREYPPYNFGKNGFNLICSYYYNTYWQPVLTDTFWMEIGRMGNRDLPEWNLADSFMTAAYVRNNFFHYLAGGVNGLVYWKYGNRNANTWPEYKHLGGVVRRIGNVQAGLQPAHRDIGMLNSFTSECFNEGETLVQAYGYENLLQAHYSIDMVSEEEIAEGRASQYKAILLYDIQYLSQPSFDALAKYADGGGLVLLDQSVPFDIPGAKRLAVDIGMGKGKTLPMPAAGAHLSQPGLSSYGQPNLVELIKGVVSEYVQPQFASSDIHVVASLFEAGGVPYTWFVNTQDGKENMFCRERMGAGQPGANTPEKITELRDWQAAEMAKGPYVTTVEYDSVPGVPYDLVSGKKLPLVKTSSGHYALTLSMERFGGVLVAWYPSEITGVELSGAKTATANQAVRLTAMIMGQGNAIPGIVPVEFTLWDPKGNTSVVSSVRGTKDGAAIFEWTPAINDPAGTWTLEATELASGKTSRTQIALHP